MGNYHAHFTPSLMSAEALEATFVQRHDLADRLVKLTSDSVTSGAQHHTLLVGPRGIGKTHLISLLYHRVVAQEDLRDKIRVAWLREEEWGVSSFLDLLLRILGALEVGYEDRDLRSQVARLYDLKREHAERRAFELLAEWLDGQALLLIAENLDDLFHSLELRGQQQFRAMVQESSNISILATTPLLFQGVNRKTFPFYGFFRIHHLGRLSLEEATALVVKSLQHRGEHDLAAKVNSGKGRARVRVIHHLAGGNHRLYSIFAQFLNAESLDQLVGPVLRTLDDLTPYYQAKVSQLAALQRKIVEILCEARGALPVQQIARKCFVTPQSASSQLTQLRRLGYVSSESYGRQSYYELSEPLMRLSVEIKKSRGKPIQLLVDFLRLWFSKADIEQRLESGSEKDIDLLYLEHAINAPEEDASASSEFTEEMGLCAQLYKGKKYHQAIEVATRLIEIRGISRDWLRLSRCLHAAGDLDAARKEAEEARRFDPSNDEACNDLGLLLAADAQEEACEYFEQAAKLDPERALYQNNIGFIQIELGAYQEAERALSRARELDSNYPLTWHNSGRLAFRRRQFENAIDFWSRAIEINDKEAEYWSWRGLCRWHLGQVELAISNYVEAIERAPDSLHLWQSCSHWFLRHGFFEAVVECCQEIKLLAPDNASSISAAAVDLYRCGLRNESLCALQEAFRITPANPLLINNRGVALYSAGRLEEARDCFIQAIDLEKNRPFHLEFNRANVEIALNQQDIALESLRGTLRLLSDSDPIKDESDMALVRNLLMSVEEPSRWPAYIDTWSEAFGDFESMALLGHGLVDSIPPATSDWLPLPRAQAWLEIWRSKGGDIPELRLPLRLLEAAVEFRASKDPRVFFSLAKEERDILKPLIRIPPADEGLEERIERLLALRPSKRDASRR